MPKFKNLEGQTINNWSIKEYRGLNKHKQSLWLIECKCGKMTQRIKTTSQMKTDKSCGCLNIENLNGLIFGRWKVISDPIFKNDGKRDRVYFRCECTCKDKTVKLVRSDMLKNKTSSSCGCYAKEVNTAHGLSRTRLYNIWFSMIDRCSNDNRSDYDRYGGRGISVCREWAAQESYIGLNNFIEWSLLNGYKDYLTIERVDVNGNYEPDNCTWASMDDQAKNKRNTIYLEIDKNQNKLVDLARENNINRSTLLNRYKSGIRNEQLLLSKKSLRTNEVVGVSYSNRDKAWRVYINYKKKRIELGRRKDKVEAIRLRLNAEAKYYGFENSPQKHLFEQYEVRANG